MLTFRDMTLDDRDTVLPMVDAFYRSNAVDHPVPREIVERSFLAAAGNEPLLRGTLIFEEGRLAGYLYVTLCYSAEVGGTCVFLEEMLLLPSSVAAAWAGRSWSGSLPSTRTAAASVWRSPR